ILGFPANEIVLPLVLMGYLSQGTMLDMTDPAMLLTILTDNGWTPLTAVCFILFSLMHWPCSTTCLTVYKETKSIRWTAFSLLLPTAFGVTLCVVFHTLCRLCSAA
ncbi:MAG: ferrous iron transporter B, partial [Acutalibacteraceae bacterium]